MIRLYRILRKKYAHAPFDGEGAYRYGGRWSSPGIRVSYASDHQSLAMLEYFVHLDESKAPDDLVLAMAEAPDDIGREHLQPRDLPVGWHDPLAPPSLARFGNEFVRRGEHCLLFVPSVVVSSEENCLINPLHPDFSKLVMRGMRPLHYDPRMFPHGSQSQP